MILPFERKISLIFLVRNSRPIQEWVATVGCGMQTRVEAGWGYAAYLALPSPPAKFLQTHYTMGTACVSSLILQYRQSTLYSRGGGKWAHMSHWLRMIIWSHACSSSHLTHLLLRTLGRDRRGPASQRETHHSCGNMYRTEIWSQREWALRLDLGRGEIWEVICKPMWFSDASI